MIRARTSRPSLRCASPLPAILRAPFAICVWPRRRTCPLRLPGRHRPVAARAGRWYHACPRKPAAARGTRDAAALGRGLMAAHGYASEGCRGDLSAGIGAVPREGRPGELERVLRGLWNVVFLRPTWSRRHARPKTCWRSPTTLAVPRCVRCPYQARPDLHAPRRPDRRSRSPRTSAGAADESNDSVRRREAPRTTVYLAWVLWYTGQPDQALACGGNALDLSGHAGSPHTRAFALGFVSWLHVFCGNMARAVELAGEQHALSIEHGLAYWRAWAAFTLGMGEHAPATLDKVW